MSGFYKKAVVWLGLNEEYQENAGVEDPSNGVQAPGGELDQMDAESGGPRVGPDRSRRGPQPRPAESEAPPQRKRPMGNPLGLDASRDSSEGSVRVVPIDEPMDTSSGADSMPSASTARPSDSALGGTVRAIPMPATVQPVVVVPDSFNDAQNVADYFREKKPVMVNLQDAERDLARRLIDFSSGLCYGLDGTMEKVDRDVYLLTPLDVEVTEEDRTNF